MDLRPITDKQKVAYNQLVTHVMQSWEWGEFRKTLGTSVLRYGLYENNKLKTAFQLTLHKIPFTNKYVGYLPKGPFPDKQLAQALQKIGQKHNCAFIKIEPAVIASERSERGPLRRLSEASNLSNPNKIASSVTHRNDNMIFKKFIQSPKPLFTKYNFIVDLTRSEEELLKNMHPKFRYNIKVAQKHGVSVEERTDDEALKEHLQLHFYTTTRQGFHSHNTHYHRTVWEILKKNQMARILIAYYQPPREKEKIPLTSWMLFNFKDILYYPYGGSSDQYKNVMASNLIAWEAIKVGKKLKCKKFDLWGTAAPNAPANDPYTGFTRFKSGLRADLIEYIGTYDLILNWPLYWIFTLVDKLLPLKIFLLKTLER